MKMLKKAAAVLLAAAMSLTMLTACGGGSGSSSLTAQALGGKFTLKYTLVEVDGKAPEEAVSETIMTDGSRYYTAESGDAQAVLMTGSDYYVINTANNKAWKASFDNSDTTGQLAAVTTTTSTGTREYKGKTYVAETSTIAKGTSKQVTTYCYDNGKLTYVIQEYVKNDAVSHTEVMHVDSLVKSVDEKLLDIGNYEMVDKFEDLGLVHEF